MIEPTPKQIENCEGFKWVYIGDRLFVKGDWIGWFTDVGFVKVLESEF